MRVLSAVAVAVVAVTLAACAPAAAPPPPQPVPTDTPRPVSDQEAAALGQLQYRNYLVGSRSVAVALQDGGHSLRLDGVIDYRTGTGLAVLTVDDAPDSVLMWDSHYVATHPSAPGIIGPVPDDLSDWALTPLNPLSGQVSALLSELVGLGMRQPLNPSVVEAGGALWLRNDSVDGTSVGVFTAPVARIGATAPPTVDPNASDAHYWITADGLLERLELRVGGTWLTIDFGTSSREIPDLPAFTATNPPHE